MPKKQIQGAKSNLKETFKMKICIISSTYPRYDKDEQVPWLRKSISKLKERGHDVRVFAPSFEGLKDHEIDGTQVYRFRYAPKSLENITHDSGATNKLQDRKSIKYLAILYIIGGLFQFPCHALKHKYDLIVVHWPFPHSIFGMVGSWISRTPFISMCHGAELALARKSKGIAKVLKFLLKAGKTVTCNSSHTRNEVIKLSGCDAKIIPYGTTLTPSSDKNYTPPFSKHNAPIQLLTVGRLIERKGLGYLLEAISLLLKKTDVHLTVIGKGMKMEQWKQQSIELGIEKNVNFSGFVSSQVLEQHYNTCDVYVHPSIHDRNGDTEGLGVVLVEALSARRPVVASRVGGIVDVIIDGETGLLVEEKNPEAIAEAVLSLVNNKTKALNLAENGLKHARNYFDWNRITDEMEKCYQKYSR